MRKTLIAFLSIAVIAVISGCTGLPTGTPTSQRMASIDISKLWGREQNREIQGGGLGMAGIWVQMSPTPDKSVYDATFISLTSFNQWIGHAQVTVLVDTLEVHWDSGNITSGSYTDKYLDFPGCGQELTVDAETLSYGNCKFDSEERTGEMQSLADSKVLGRTLFSNDGYTARIDKLISTDEFGFNHFEGSMYLNAQLIYNYEVVDYGTGILRFVFADGQSLFAQTSLVEQVGYDFNIYFDCTKRTPWADPNVCTFNSK